MCGKKDWGIIIGESNFLRTAELKIANEQVFIEIAIKQWEMILLTWKYEFKIGNHTYS